MKVLNCLIIILFVLLFSNIVHASEYIETSDGLNMTYTSIGDVEMVEIDSDNMSILSLDGGFSFIEYYTNGSDTGWIALNDTITKHAAGNITYNVTEQNISFNFSLDPYSNYIKVHCEIDDLDEVDRAIQIRYNVPINATGWNWGEYIREEQTISTTTKYDNTHLIGTTRTQNTYPFSSICNSSYGLALAVPMDVPRIYRTWYDTDDGFIIEYDIGLANCTTKIGNSTANFTYILYKVDEPEWGFRGMLTKYYSIYPMFFTKRHEKEGTLLWIDSRISSIPNASDFGFAFDVRHDFTHDTENTRQRYNVENGIWSFQYTEPSGWWRGYGSNSTKPTYDQRVADLIEDSINGSNRTWGNIVTVDIIAQAVINSSIYDENDKLCLDADDYFWHYWSQWMQNYPTNMDSEIPSPNRYEISYKKYQMASDKNVSLIENWLYEHNASLNSSVYYNGSYSAELNVTNKHASTYPGRWLSNDIIVESNTNYTFSAWGKTNDTTGDPGVRIVQSNDSVEQINYSSQKHLHFGSGTSDWAKENTTFITLSTTDSVFIYVNIWNGNGTFWVDDVELYKNGTSENLVVNAGFENVTYSPSKIVLEGFGVDSIQSTTDMSFNAPFAPLENYRRSHWEYSDAPLIFNSTTKQINLLNVFSQYEYLDRIADDLHPDKCVLSNIFPYSESYYGHTIDIFVNEIFDYNIDDADTAYKRSLIHNKVYTSILLEFEKGMSNTEMSIYFNKSLFYGVFPSIKYIGGSSSDYIYWNNATLYERDRNLFKKCIPPLVKISTAGWEPISYTECSNSDIKFERYGSNESNVYITIGNEASSDQSGGVKSNLTELTLYDCFISTENMITDSVEYHSTTDGILNISIVDIGANDTFVYNITSHDGSITPSSNNISVKTYDWSTTTADRSYKKWNESCTNSSVTSDHVIGDFDGWTQITIRLNGTDWNVYNSNSDGYISFTYDGGYSENQFEAYESIIIDLDWYDFALMRKNGTDDQTFSEIADTIYGDEFYTWYNSTSDLWESYWVGYGYNEDFIIPQNDSYFVAMGYNPFGLIPPITCAQADAQTIAIPTGWHMTYLRELGTHNLTTIKADMGGNVVDLYGWDVSANAWTDTGTFEVNPNEGLYVNSSSSFNWDGTVS